MTIQVARMHAPAGRLPVQMAKSQGTALPLLKSGDFGADLIRFAPGEGVAEHTHPGDHILVCISGEGWVDYDGEPTRLEPGVCYYVPGAVRHAIRSESELTLLSVANAHIDAGSPQRLDLT